MEMPTPPLSTVSWLPIQCIMTSSVGALILSLRSCSKCSFGARKMQHVCTCLYNHTIPSRYLFTCLPPSTSVSLPSKETSSLAPQEALCWWPFPRFRVPFSSATFVRSCCPPSVDSNCSVETEGGRQGFLRKFSRSCGQGWIGQRL